MLGVATFSQLGASVTQQGTIVLGVFFASTYGLTLGQMGAVVSSLTLGLVVSGLVVGSLVDRFGARRVLFLGTIALTFLAAAIGVARLLPLTVALLFALGLALGTVPVSGTKIILLAYPRERRGLPMGVRQMGVPLGAIVAALALPPLAAQLGLHPLYLGFAVLLAGCGFAFCAVLPRQEAGRTHSSGSGSLPRLRHEADSVIVHGICCFMLAWGQYSLSTYTIPMLHADGLSIAAGGALLAVSQAGGAVARMVLGHLSDRLGARRALVLMGAAACGAVLACLVAFLPPHVPGVLLALLWFLLGASMVGWNALLLTWAGERVSVHNAGAAIGLTTSALLAGAAVSAPAFGFIVELSGGYRIAWLSLAAVLAGAALLLWAQQRWTARARPFPRVESATSSRPWRPA